LVLIRFSKETKQCFINHVLLFYEVSDNYKLWIDAGGQILNIVCECPAGKGPYGTCKHVAAVALSLAAFSQDKQILVGQSCTEQLQSIHKPKRQHYGLST